MIIYYPKKIPDNITEDYPVIILSSIQIIPRRLFLLLIASLDHLKQNGNRLGVVAVGLGPSSFVIQDLPDFKLLISSYNLYPTSSGLYIMSILLHAQS